MTGDKTTPSKDDPSFTPCKKELNRLLLAQFYETSVRRYGTDSEQARILSKLRTDRCFESIDIFEKK
jgi:hypothetical protein